MVVLNEQANDQLISKLFLLWVKLDGSEQGYKISIHCIISMCSFSFLENSFYIKKILIKWEGKKKCKYLMFMV